MKKFVARIIITLVVILLGFAIYVFLTPTGRTIFNTYKSELQKTDDKTLYEARKKVEDTCRAYIANYDSDKSIYDTYKNGVTQEEKSWAAAAKIRANKSATFYNDYLLKNNYVWSGNVPSDIRKVLPLIE